MNNVLIIGYGVVGHNLHKEIESVNPSVWDKYKSGTIKQNIKYDVAFVCVDTPLVGGCMLDCVEVKNAICENESEIYVIKSTVPVGTVDALRRETGKRIIFSPEYYGGTQHCNNFQFDFTILGGEKQDCVKVQQLLQNVYDGRHKFYIVDAKTAEMVKFMENAWLATKVSFCCDFYDACKKSDIDYETLRELFILDPRVNQSHTFVYEDHPYFKSHCLDKDVPSIANQFDMNLIKFIVENNKKRRERY